MHEKIAGQYLKRISQFIAHIKPDIWREFIPLSAEIAVTEDWVDFKDRMNLTYRPVHEGDSWGKAWDSAWFRLRAEVPEAFAGRELCLQVSSGGEMLVFDAEGVPVYGLTAFSQFDCLYTKECMPLPGTFKAGEKLEFWMEAAANQLFGIRLADPNDPVPEAPRGSYSPSVKHLRLCVFDRELWNLRLDMVCLQGVMLQEGLDTARGKQLFHTLNLAIDAYGYDPANAAAARKVLAERAFSRKAASTALKAYSVGHAHIDVGWLWPTRESTRKAARTFASQLALMDRYPDFVFGASQAHLYKAVKERYPALFEKIRARVKEGRWEIQGGMWVEADCNIISGESMVRQFLHAKNFFMDEFGFDVKTLWIPDVFGYAASTPQIMKKSGCDYFLTQKMSWSEINTFPHHTFRWTGVDSTQVITHFPPENTYNANGFPEERIKAADSFREAGYLPGFMSLFGIGDGGGGPSEEHVENNLRMCDLDACPKTVFSRADDFFRELETYADELPVWKGELYLEKHRGTLTTQAHTKRNNRKCEQRLTALEKLCSALPDADYPAAMLNRSWETVLLNQFHDIIPGSSIREVYEVTEKQHAAVLADVQKTLGNVFGKLFRKQENALTLVNTLSRTWHGSVLLPEGWRSAAGVPCQKLPGGRVAALVTIPGDSVRTLFRSEAEAAPGKPCGKVLENALVRYVFDDRGRLVSAEDKQTGTEYLSAPGNVMSLYNDRPIEYEAWDIDIFYRRDRKDAPVSVTVEEALTGPVLSELNVTFRTKDSVLTQRIVLHPDSRRLDFITHADWHEYRTMLRTGFPVTVNPDQATFDIQYAFVRRAAHENTSWEAAQFESCAQRYADLSGPEYGIALLNDCKYGYRIRDGLMELNLLRSPKHPDFFADLGEHDFTYSFFPHEGSAVTGGVEPEAAVLNRDLLWAEGYASEEFAFPCRLDSEGVSLEVVKKAEKDSSRILRLVETRGMHSKALLHVPEGKTLSETNLIEWEHGPSVPLQNGTAELLLKPFEIRTLRLK